jgi:hypothetical protein
MTDTPAPRPAPDARPFAELRAALAASTQGEWCHGAKPGGRRVTLKRRHWELGVGPGTGGRGIAFVFGDDEADAAFCSVAHNTLPDVLAQLDAVEARAARIEAERDALMFLCDKVGRFLDRQGYDRRYCEDHGLRIRGDIDAEIASIRLVVAALAPASPAPEAEGP